MPSDILAQQIFRGNISAHPVDIRDSIGWQNNLQLHELAGAVMTLCNYNTMLERRVEQLEKRMKRDVEPDLR